MHQYLCLSPWGLFLRAERRDQPGFRGNYGHRRFGRRFGNEIYGKPASALMILAVVIGSILFGMVYSLLLAVSAINFKADQTLIGTAMNLLGTAAATVFVKAINMAENVNNVSSSIQYIEQRKAFSAFKIGNFEVSWFMILAVVLLIIAHIVLYKHVWPSPESLRRASSGSGFCRYQRIQNALCRRSDLRPFRGPWRDRLYHCRSQ